MAIEAGRDSEVIKWLEDNGLGDVDVVGFRIDVPLEGVLTATVTVFLNRDSLKTLPQGGWEEYFKKKR